MKKEKVLITGAAGLLGANFSRYLSNRGYDVIGIDNLTGGYRDHVDPHSRFYFMDLENSKFLNEIFELEKPDYVYHFAAYAAEGLSPFIRSFNYHNNVVCSSNLINSCINFGVRKIIFTSSMAVYGEGQLPFSENQLPCPEDSYGIAKYAIELDLALAKREFGLDYAIVRPHNVAGIYQNIWDRYRNVIGIWIRKSLRGMPLTIFGDGTQVRSFSDIQYYMEPFLRLMYECSGEVFNIGADHYHTINEVSEIVQDVAKDFGKTVDRTWVEKRNEVHVAYCDHEKAKDLLGFQDRTNLRKLVYDMFLWAKSQPQREVKTFDYEIKNGIYSFWGGNES